MKIKFCERKFQQQAPVSAVATSQQKPQWRSGWTYTEWETVQRPQPLSFFHQDTFTLGHFLTLIFPPQTLFRTRTLFHPDTFHSDTFPTRTFSHQDTFPTKTPGHFFPRTPKNFTRTLFSYASSSTLYPCQ